MKEKIFEYITETYSSDIEHPWPKYPEYAVFRHDDNKKWYGLVMNIEYSKLGIDKDGYTDILNIKTSDFLKRDFLIQQEGIFKGYHIARGNWVSILLDGTVQYDFIISLIDESFRVTASAKKKQAIRPPKEWIIPANPKYYDIEHAFDTQKEIDWKQGSGIKKGDTVYMYVAAPVSSILFKCKVTKTDIPYKYSGKNLQIKAIMRIKLEKRYPYGKFSFDILKEKYDIRAVRGPRSIPESLSKDL